VFRLTFRSSFYATDKEQIQSIEDVLRELESLLVCETSKSISAVTETEDDFEEGREIDFLKDLIHKVEVVGYQTRDPEGAITGYLVNPNTWRQIRHVLNNQIAEKTNMNTVRTKLLPR
jgi:hypothetical protein